jgi:hypothetical protein
MSGDVKSELDMDKAGVEMHAGSTIERTKTPG